MYNVKKENLVTECPFVIFHRFSTILDGHTNRNLYQKTLSLANDLKKKDAFLFSKRCLRYVPISKPI